MASSRARTLLTALVLLLAVAGAHARPVGTVNTVGNSTATAVTTGGPQAADVCMYRTCTCSSYVASCDGCPAKLKKCTKKQWFTCTCQKCSCTA